MAYDGSLRFDTSVDASGLQDGASRMSKIVKASFVAIGAAATTALAVIGKVGIGYNAQMEEYTTNFTTMLGSQEAAIKKVEALKDMAAKTPFGLDDLAKSTQTLLAFGIESDSTMGILRQLGDVSLGNKGKFESLTLAFAQMSSTGRLMGQDLNQMINAGFNPLQEISRATGKSMAELKKEMEQGAISADMVAEAFTMATSAGGKFYNGMEAASKTLHGQWSTLKDDASAAAGAVFQPFNDVLSSQVLPNIIVLVADLTENLSSPKMQGAMTEIAQGLGKIIEVVAKVASVALPPLVGAISDVISVMDVMIPTMGVVATAFAAYKTFTFITNFYEGLKLIKAGYIAMLGTEAAATAGTTAALWAYNTALNAKMIALIPVNAAIVVYNVLTGASIPLLGAATAAQWGLNAAMLANPIGLIVAGVAALIAGLVVLIMWLASGSKEYQKQKEEVESLSKAQEELATATDGSADAYKSNAAEIAASGKVSKAFVGVLKDVSSSTLSAAEKHRKMADTVAQLNTSVEGLNIAYDEETGAIHNVNTGQEISLDQLEQLVSAKVELAQANAWQERANELVREQVQIQEDLAVIEAKKQEIMANSNLNTREQEKLIKELDEAAAGHATTMEDVELRLGVVNDNLAATNTTMAESVVSDYGRMEQAMTENGENIDGVAARWGVSVDSIKTAWADAGGSFDEFVTAQEEAMGEYTEAVQSHTESVVNSFKEIPAEYEMSAEKMIETLRTNRERYAEWKQAMVEISGQVSTETLAELDKLGPGALSAINQMRENGGAGLREFDEEIRAIMSDSTGYVTQSLNDPSFIGAPASAFEASAQQLAENTALPRAAVGMMESTKTAAEAVDFSVVGQSIAADIVGGLNSADVAGAMNSITAAIQNSSSKVTSAATGMSNSVQSVFRTMSTQSQNTVTQMMTSINSAIVSRSNTIKSSITSMGNGVISSMNTMKTQAVNIATQMMTDINSAIVSRTGTVKASATAAANSVVNGLQGMVSSAANVANNMMDGIGYAMDRKASSLYSKAREIANRIASIMADALDVHSPSRVMIRLFENVMMGIYVGMEGMSGMLFREAESIADGIAERLTISPDVASTLAEQLRRVTEANPLGSVTLAPQPAYAGAGSGTSYVTSLTQHITTPKPLSPSEMTREGQNLLRRQRWQLP